MKRKATIIISLVIGVLILSACQPADGGAEPDRVVYLINGALGDNAFYDSGQFGIDLLEMENELETRTIECNFDPAEYEPALRAAVDYADVIFVISYGFEDLLREYADDNPDKIFVNLDTVVQNEANTITSVDFIEEESSFLAGVVAGMVTIDPAMPNVNDQKVIGAVGGDVDPVIEAFVFAYTNGAQHIDPEITVETRYLGDWEDTAKAKTAALQLYDQGSDINFQIAAAAGMGVLQAAGERDLYAIGVDTNQNDTVPGNVVASAIKDVGLAIIQIYTNILEESYEPGQVLEYGLASGAVDIAFEENQDVLPTTITQRVDELRAQIINGTLTVERYQP
ncbi:MAG: BMP family ABC transporter substrate-binding protein [Brevefilum sp.]